METSSVKVSIFKTESSLPNDQHKAYMIIYTKPPAVMCETQQQMKDNKEIVILIVALFPLLNLASKSDKPHGCWESHTWDAQGWSESFLPKTHWGRGQNPVKENRKTRVKELQAVTATWRITGEGKRSEGDPGNETNERLTKKKRISHDISENWEGLRSA